jgi:CheY-like chemotaxis protein
MASQKVLFLKEEGTHPLSEGLLARFARIHTLRSILDLQSLESSAPHIIIVQASMPTLDGFDVLRRIQEMSKRAPLLLLVDANQPPDRLAGKLAELSALRATRPRRPSLARMQGLLGVSQEILARILGVSSRTAYRWIKGGRPRRNPVLERLQALVDSLEDTLDTPEAIRAYLHNPNPGLDGEKPVSLLLQGDFSRVEDSLLAIREGVYV